MKILPSILASIAIGLIYPVVYFIATCIIDWFLFAVLKRG